LSAVAIALPGRMVSRALIARHPHGSTPAKALPAARVRRRRGETGSRPQHVLSCGHLRPLPRSVGAGDLGDE
jgi:hypothetical protein